MPAEYALSNVWIGIAIVIILFIIFYSVGWLASRKTTSDEDFYAAGFSIGPVTNGLGMAATWASLATFLGVIALILKLQVPFVYLWIQWAISIPLLTLLYGTSLRRMKAFTPASFIRQRYGKPSTVVIVCWMILIMVMYALGQMIGLGQAFELLFGVPYNIALVVAGLATVGFITIGGMYGASYNAAFQMVVMTIAMIVPMGAIMKAMGSSGWWFPPLAYGDMVPDMIKAIPTFFDMKYDFRWYFALIPAFTLGPVALPHLAMRVFTSSSVKNARWAVVWFAIFLGLLFSGTYVVGFAGNYFTATTGRIIAKPDQTLLILNVFYNPTLVAAFVMGGALAAGLSTIGGNLMAIAGLVGSDLLGIIAPDMDTKKKMRWGYVALGIGGIMAILMAFKPPKFLVTSILWAFGLLATTATPAILLGVWWKEANKLALMVSSIFCGVLFIVISPHVFPSICVGTGLVAKLGMSGGMVTIPLSFAMFILLSILFNRLEMFKAYAPTLADKMVIDRIHGWGPDYDETRYNGIVWPLVIVAVCIGVFFWGLVPWS
ncbi:Na+/solute symporter [Desulfamplus magnetovallimortis]|uniref:Na+/solute symporter n=1 Tax=Desulfamplus magnetovallimortis TaxID=1246637 RepID=A0A1W1HI41_9BACT|nr:sodium:solute symporter [Desulfamplus magnetovallimortis]SLM32085.1 Na+/solute symporter [Desulfamplus magnetovallimortis]